MMFMDEFGTLTSPQYPNNYPVNVNCTWTFNTTVPSKPGLPSGFFLQFVSFDLEGPMPECMYDSLTIYNGTTGEMLNR